MLEETTLGKNMPSKMNSVGGRLSQFIQEESEIPTRLIINLCCAGIARPHRESVGTIAEWIRHPQSRRDFLGYMMGRPDTCADQVRKLALICRIGVDQSDSEFVQRNVNKIDEMHRAGCEATPPTSGLFGMAYWTTIEHLMTRHLLPRLVQMAEKEGLLIDNTPPITITQDWCDILCEATEREANTGYSTAPFGTIVSDGVIHAVEFVEYLYGAHRRAVQHA